MTPKPMLVAPAELRALIREAVAEALAARPEWLTKNDVAERLGVTPRTVTNLVARGLPSHRRDGILRFKADEVDAWMAQR